MNNKKLTIRLTMEQYSHLKKQSDTAGLKLEPFIRNLIMQTKISPRPPDEWIETVRLLSTVANNINQIARVANTYKTVNYMQIYELQKQLELIWKEVKKVQ